MKAAWTCRACSRRLQARQATRPSLQDATIHPLPPTRRLASLALSVDSDALDVNRQSSQLSLANSNRFTEAPSHPRTPDSTQSLRGAGEKKVSEDPFESAFRTRRGQPGGRSKARRKSKAQPNNATSALWDLKPSKTVTIPENLTSLEIGIEKWKQLCAEIRSGSEPKWLVREEVSWIAELSRESVRDVWADLPDEKKRQLWRHLVLTTILKRPERTPMVLLTTLTEPLPLRSCVNDVLHIILLLLKKPTLGHRAKHDMVEQTLQAALHYIKIKTPKTNIIRPATLGMLAKHLSRQQLSELYDAVKDLSIPLSLDTELQFASRFGGLRASDAHREKAFEILRGIVSRGEKLMDPRIASVITSLLHQKSTGEKSTFAPMQVLQYFMENGFLPSAITVTALVETLCERSEFHEAIHLVKLFSANGLKLDAKACDVLLKGAQHTHNDEQLEAALKLSKSLGAPGNLLAKHAIHAIYLRIQHEAQEAQARRSGSSSLAERKALWEKPRLAQENQEAFIAMLRFYTERFELGSFQSLVPQTLPYLVWNEAEAEGSEPWKYKETLLPLLKRSLAVPEKSPLSPCSETLALLLRAYVKSLWRPYDLMSMYSFFKSRLRDPQGEGVAASNIVKERGSFIHDSFILAMMQTHALVRPALEVFGDMLKDNFRDSNTGIHPPPSVFTFTIILAGLSRHRENKLFDNFKHIMEENGVTPNLVTTTTFVKNHASRQDVASTVGALRELESLGYLPNQFTFDAFGRLRNQQQALDLMSKIIDENKRRSLGMK